MARGATIHRAALEVSNLERDVYAELSLTVAQHPSETLERVIVRVLAYALRYEEGLEFGRGVSTDDEPDLWSRHGDGRIRQWIDVGRPDPKRLVKASRRSERVVVFAFGRGAERWFDAARAELSALANLSVAHVEDAFVAALAAQASRSMQWSLTFSDGSLYLASDGERLETQPSAWLAAPFE